MTDAEGFDPAAHEVFVSGSFGGTINWSVPGTNPDLKLSRDGQSMQFSITLELEADDYQYKYASDAFGQGWDGAEWEGNPNRSVTLEEDLTVLDIWGIHPDDLSTGDFVNMYLNVFPNPAGTVLNIHSAEYMKNVSIIDLTGRLVHRADIHDAVYQLNVSSFENGVYFLKVVTSKGLQVSKVQIIK
jgi:hypothetical protein